MSSVCSYGGHGTTATRILVNTTDFLEMCTCSTK